MIVGTVLTKLGGTSYYSPEFARGGLAATFSVQVWMVYNTPTFTITVQHRNADDTTWSSAGTFSSITATGDAAVDLTGLKEIVRFKYDFDGGDAATAAIHFIMQAPAWRPYQ